MFKKLVFGACSFLFLFYISTSLEVAALTFEKLPVGQKSKQWAVQIGEAEKGKDLVKPVKGKFSTYSLKIDRIGEDVDSVKINLFRNEPNSKTKYSLFSCPPNIPCSKENDKKSFDFAKQMNEGYPYVFSNFVLAEKATELEVEVIWTDKNEGRPMKETFIFTDN